MFHLPYQSQDTSSPIPGYGIEDITWGILTTPGGPTVNATGTIQQAIQLVQQNNPRFRSDFAMDLKPRGIKRADGNLMEYESLRCEEWQNADASWDMLAEDIFDLRHISGKPANGPGPGKCGRVHISCRVGAAI
ncbi:hypothetical protein B0H65DRAFT_536814 [Neurospora tetraspora]|uniref:Uncharacterized protein n=1 Tax=Neurospora tetraspora TaxID=94610 RepID=A0AAE0MUY7_9PEZI|nr:hypothetical protein B0H65DRAFT_536814 [Neurospora tetraspora]